MSQTEREYIHKLTYDQPATRSPGLPFNGFHLRNPCNYITDTLVECIYMGYYSLSDPGGMEG